MAVDKKQYSELAKLNLGMQQDRLAEIVADNWSEPGDDSDGYFLLQVASGGISFDCPFGARLTVDGHIGQLSYYAKFPIGVDINGFKIGMARNDALKHCVNVRPNPEYEDNEFEQEGLLADWKDGTDVSLVFVNARLLAITFNMADAQYPSAMSPEAKQVRAGLRAYDMEMQHRLAEADNNQGWVFGLPPGISTSQWPLDPISGYPLMHGFTLLLPEDYRIHGPDIVAISFFATAADQNDGGADEREDLKSAITGAAQEHDQNADLAVFRAHANNAHPRLHRMTDILGYAYAVILLTEKEFKGTPCQPPDFAPNSYLTSEAKPEWLSVGAGYAFYKSYGGLGRDDLPTEETFAHKIIGSVPEKSLEWNRAISWAPRDNDPNSGIPPEEVYDKPSDLGYECPYDPQANFERKSWATSHKADHIGGTMYPIQGTPRFSPFYIGFEEYFGGYNFGTGNAQLDFLQMRFDWACG